MNFLRQHELPNYVSQIINNTSLVLELVIPSVLNKSSNIYLIDKLSFNGQELKTCLLPLVRDGVLKPVSTHHNCYYVTTDFQILVKWLFNHPNTKIACNTDLVYLELKSKLSNECNKKTIKKFLIHLSRTSYFDKTTMTGLGLLSITLVNPVGKNLVPKNWQTFGSCIASKNIQITKQSVFKALVQHLLNTKSVKVSSTEVLFGQSFLECDNAQRHELGNQIKNYLVTFQREGYLNRNKEWDKNKAQIILLIYKTPPMTVITIKSLRAKEHLSLRDSEIKNTLIWLYTIKILKMSPKDTSTFYRPE